jgi:hypothetical protein
MNWYYTVLVGRFKSASATYYVVHDPEKLTDKYAAAWRNFGIASATLALNLIHIVTELFLK